MDTNIVVRLIVADDDRQVAAALELAQREAFFVGFAVLVEVDWVLRSRYGYERERVVSALHALAALVRVRFEHDEDAWWAIDRYAEAGELADYVHVAASRKIGRFATFDRRLARRAGAETPVAVETLA